jgi:general secretion pathway protein H
MTRRQPPRSPASGFTLIEIMVTLAIVALLTGGAIKGLRSLRRTDLREATTHMSGAVRYLFDRASTTGKVHRLVIDIDTGRYWAEISDDRFYVPHEAESEQALRAREDKEAEEDEEARRLREERERRQDTSTPSSSSFDLSKLEVADFRPKRARFAAFKEMALKPVQLKKAKLRSVYTPRVVDALTTGRAYLYFFPLGQTEPAIITLSDMSGGSVYSLVVHPITGRVKIYNEQVEPPAGRNRYDDQGNPVVQ